MIDFRALFECSTAAQLVLLADDPVFTIVAASDAYVRTSGLPRGDLLGRGLFELPAKNRPNEDLRASLRRAIAAKAPDKIGNASSTPVPDADGTVQYILYALEQEPAISEKRFRQLTESSVFGLIIADTEGNVSYVNPQLLALLGYTQEEIDAGLVKLDQLTPPEYAQVSAEAWRQVVATGRCAPYEKVYVAKNGRRVPVLIGSSLLESVNGRTEAAGFVLDLTERKQSERDAFLVRLDDATRPLADPDEILETASRLLGEHLRADRCSYCTFEPDEETFKIELDYVRPGVLRMAGRYRMTDFGAAAAHCLQTNQSYVVDNVETDPRTREAQGAYLAIGVRASTVAPLWKAGKLVAAMGVHQHTPRAWLAEETELLKLVANRCWESIERVRMARAWQDSEARLRLAQRAARIGSFEWMMKDNRIIWTPELEALYGLAEGAFEGTFADWTRRIVPEDAARVQAQLQSCVARQQTECAYEFRVVLPDGTRRWLRGQAQFIYDESGAVERMIGVNIDIDGQKQAEADLRESEERLRAIFDGTYEYIGLLAPDGTLLEANRASLEFAGNTRQDVVGRPFWDTPWFTATPGAPETIRAGIERAAAGESVRFEATVRRPSGECPTFDISLHPVRNAQGEVVLIVPEGRDITERKLAEERLRQQWHRFDAVLSHAPDITYTFDLEGRFTYANRELLARSQRALKDTIGKNAFEVGYPRDLAERIQRQIQQVIETKRQIRDQTQFKLKTGEIRYYEYIYGPVIGEDGNVEAIAGTSRDITERIEAEERLRESEARFRQLVDSMPQLVWSSLPDGRDDLYNKQWFEYTGLSFEQAGGNGGQIIHPDDAPLAWARWNHSLKSGEPYEIEYRCRRFDGEYRWFLGRAAPIFDEHGQVIRWFGTCTDIHAQKESEAALRKAHRELEEFSYVASHDLQEPLRMVNIYTQLILRELGEGNARLNQFATFVRQGVQRMEALIQDLLTFSRVLHAEQPQAGTADLSVSLQEALDVLRTRIEETTARIESEALPVVCGDPEQMAHVFQNLLSNSLKYCKKEIAPEIRISAERRGAEWVICVRDNGIGFEPQYSQRVFGLFKRLHKEQYPGTGLGLAICQRIVERYGGKMWAEGKPGVGAAFYFSLRAA